MKMRPEAGQAGTSHSGLINVNTTGERVSTVRALSSQLNMADRRSNPQEVRPTMERAQSLGPTCDAFKSLNELCWIHLELA